MCLALVFMVEYMDVLMIVYCFFELYGDHRDLHVLTHSFPTRRSSDLFMGPWQFKRYLRPISKELRAWKRESHKDHRSEEHTSELQSLMRISYAVFCLKQKNFTSLTSMYPPPLLSNPNLRSCKIATPQPSISTHTYSTT